MTATCVEAVWQGLKVFENSDIDVETFKNDTMKGLKRTVRRFGPIRGHRKGEKLLNYIEARKQIYIPTYEWVLKNVPAVKDFVSQIAKKAKEKDVVLLDYSTNTDINNTKSPVSHAGIVKEYIEKRYPEVKKDFTKPALKKPKSKKSSSKKGKKGKRTSEPIQTEIPW